MHGAAGLLSGPFVPFGHLKHCFAPAAEWRPFGHGVHFLPFQNFPAAQETNCARNRPESVSGSGRCSEEEESVNVENYCLIVGNFNRDCQRYLRGSEVSAASKL